MRRLAFISFSHDLMLGRAGTLTARAPKGPSGCIMPAPCAHASSSEQRLCWHAAARAVHGEAHPAPGPAPLASGRSSWLALSRPGPRTGGARSCGSGSALPASASAAGQSRRRRRRCTHILQDERRARHSTALFSGKGALQERTEGACHWKQTCPCFSPPKTLRESQAQLSREWPEAGGWGAWAAPVDVHLVGTLFGAVAVQLWGQVALGAPAAGSARLDHRAHQHQKR